MTEQASTIHDVVVGLDRVVGELPPTDGMKWFALLYRDVTKAIEDAYDEGAFQVPRGHLRRPRRRPMSAASASRREEATSG